MSERGSFVTEFIYCDKCFAAAKEVLLGRGKYLCSVTIPPWDGLTAMTELPIIAGKIGGLHAGEEEETLLYEWAPELSERICHPMRIAVLAECPSDGVGKILRIEPTGEKP